MQKIRQSLFMFLFTLPLFLTEASAVEEVIKIHQPPLMLVGYVCDNGQIYKPSIVQANHLGMHITALVHKIADGCHVQVRPFKKLRPLPER